MALQIALHSRGKNVRSGIIATRNAEDLILKSFYSKAFGLGLNRVHNH
jgi:hypothetical protein